MLSILDHNPAAKIIANDLGFRILDCWKDLLESKRPDSDVCFARFDMKSIPFADNSIDAVSSYGGFSNIPDRWTAIAESCRVLKPGGTIYLNDGELDPESFRRLPPEAQDEWRKIEPGMGTGLIEMLEESGVQISMKAEPARVVLKPGESTLADIGQRHGVELSIINYRMTAVKPW